MNTKEIIDRIFKDPSTCYSLTEFQDLAKPFHEILTIYPGTGTSTTGQDAGKTKGELQVEKHQRGTSGQLDLYPFDIRCFKVWVAPESLQRPIRDLYDQAATEHRSSELLDQATTRVEQLIEAAAA